MLGLVAFAFSFEGEALGINQSSKKNVGITIVFMHAILLYQSIVL